MQRFFSAISTSNATTVVLVLTELLGFYTISTMLLLRSVVRVLPGRPAQGCSSGWL